MKKILSVLLVLLLILSFVGCNTQKDNESDRTQNDESESNTEAETGSDPGTDEIAFDLTLVKNGETDYCIVFPANTSAAIVGAARDLMLAFQGTYKVQTPIKVDTLKDGEGDEAKAHEILIGKTNRSASSKVFAQLKSRAYTACAVGDQIVLLGDTEQGTLLAVEKWIAANFTSASDTLSFSNHSAFCMKRPLMVSIMGDSISIYEGIADSADYNTTLVSNAKFYTSSHMPVTSTWWHRVITGMGGELCVNNSYAGGRVSQAHTQTRAANLHNNAGVTPDVILIYYGINDYHNAVGVSDFSSAYDQMLETMKGNYPNAKIYCCTLNAIIYASHDTTLEKNSAGVTITTFNNVIQASADKNGAEVIDLYSRIGTEVYLHTFDKLHPNAEGMKLMSDVMLEQLHKDFF